MAESQEDIDALLAEVSALADEAIADVGGVESSPGAPAGPQTAPAAPEPATRESPPAADAGPAPVSAGRPPVPPPKAPDPGTAIPGPRLEDPARLLYIEVPVIVRLARTTMPLGDIVSLSTGAIIEFDKPSDSQLDLMINNKCIGQGQAVKVGENFGLRVNSIGSVRERIKAMGKH